MSSDHAHRESRSIDLGQDWDSIVKRGFESKDLDYKGPCVWDKKNKKACCELVKDILALANTKGGFLVLGVSEVGSGFSWDGLSQDDSSTFETTRLNSFVQNYADPPINTTVVHRLVDGKNYVIVQVPRFQDTPHICQKDFEGVLNAGAIYVRTDNNESAPIKKSSDMRAIVEHAIRNRSDQLLSSFRAILTSSGVAVPEVADSDLFKKQIEEARQKCGQQIPELVKACGFQETIIRPATFQSERFTFSELEAMLASASVTYRGMPYILYSARSRHQTTRFDDWIELKYSVDQTFQYWRIHRSGAIYLCHNYLEDQDDATRKQRVFGANALAYTCAEAVQALVDLYTGHLADEEYVSLTVRLKGTKGRKLALTRGDQYLPWTEPCSSSRVDVARQFSLAEWRAGIIELAFDVLSEMHREFDAVGPADVEAREVMRRLLDRRME